MPLLTAFETLQRLARPQAPTERCQLCGVAVASTHEHLVEPAARRILCVCAPCAMLFSVQPGQRYKRVPNGARLLLDFHLTDANWESMAVPINLAFFLRNSRTDAVAALYPSPAGATQATVPVATWNQIVDNNPELQKIEADIEALLVNRLGAQHGFQAHQYYIAPIDECYKLVGLVRAHWRGLSGGEELWRALQGFFAALTPGSGEGRYA